jgi:hypothetical protein
MDDKLTVGAAKEKIIEQVEAFENGCIAFDEGVALFSPILRARLPDHRNLRKAGVKSGHLVLLL